MKTIIILYALILVGSAVYLAPRCQAGQAEFQLGGMLMGGCALKSR